MTVAALPIQHSAFGIQHVPLAWTAPIHLEYFRWYTGVLLFLALGLPIVLLGMRSCASGSRSARGWRCCCCSS